MTKINLEKLLKFINRLEDICVTSTEEELLEYYNKNFKLTFEDQEVEFPFDALSATHVKDLLADLYLDY